MRFFFFHETKLDHRDIKIKREAVKRGLEVSDIDIYCQCFPNGSWKRDFLFNKDDFAWLTSNAVLGHLIIRNLTLVNPNNFIWPDISSIFLVDKYNASVFFDNCKISTPKTILVNNFVTLNELANEIGGFPCVLKRTNGSHGSGVAVVNSVDEIANFYEEEFLKSKRMKTFSVKKGFFILQELIKEANGSDYRVLCIEDEIIGGIKRISQTEDFRANVSLGGKAEAFEVPEELAAICRKIMQEGKLFYAGLDFIWSEEKGWLAIEINTCAQFEGFEKATGINVAGKIVDKLIKKAPKS